MRNSAPSQPQSLLTNLHRSLDRLEAIQSLELQRLGLLIERVRNDAADGHRERQPDIILTLRRAA